MKKNKLTRQGVRDLNVIKAPPAGKRLELPGTSCTHPQVKETPHGDSKCIDCDSMWDFSGQPY